MSIVYQKKGGDVELSDGVIEWGSVGADGGADGRRRGRAGAWVTFGLWAGGGRDGGHSLRFGAALSEGVSADDWGRSAEGPRRCMGYLWILGGRRAVREERSEDWVRERREERGGGQGGGRDDAEVRARSEDGREREQRGAR